MSFIPPKTVVRVHCHLNSRKGPALPCVFFLILVLEYEQKYPDAEKIQEIVFNRYGHDITEVKVAVVEDQRYQNTDKE